MFKGPSKAKFVRPFNSIPEQEEEEGGLVLHSRGSLLLQDYDQPVQVISSCLNLFYQLVCERVV